MFNLFFHHLNLICVWYRPT